MEVVSTVTNMGRAIMAGNVGAIANAVNNVLKRLLPLVLGFVGALVGINGVVTKIQGIFRKVTMPARKMVQKLMMKFQKLVKKLMAKFAKKKGKPGKGEKLAGENDGDVGIPDGTFGERMPVRVNGEDHTLVSEETGGGRVMMHSSPQPLDAFLKGLKAKGVDVGSAESSGREAQTRAKQLADKQADVRKKKYTKGSPEAKAARKELRRLDSELEGKLAAVRNALSALTGTVHINTSRLWSGKGRPGSFRKSTLVALADKFRDKHEPTGTRVLPGNDRRHIKAFSIIRNDYQLALQGRKFDEAQNYLKARGQTVKPENAEITAGAKRALTDEYNDLSNLFVAGSATNQELGRELGGAQKDQRAALKEGAGATTDTEKAEAGRKAEQAGDRIAKSGVDVPEKAEQGVDERQNEERALSSIGERAIDSINVAVKEVLALRGATTRDDARGIELLATVNSAVRTLQREVQMVRALDVDDVRAGLRNGVRVEEQLGRWLTSSPNRGAKVLLSDDERDGRLL